MSDPVDQQRRIAEKYEIPWNDEIRWTVRVQTKSGEFSKRSQTYYGTLRPLPDAAPTTTHPIPTEQED